MIRKIAFKHGLGGGLLCLAALTLCPASASAQSVLPAATSVVDCTELDGTHVGGTNGCAAGKSTASVTTAPGVALTASASYDAMFPASASGFAELTYNFAVLGGVQDTVVPVNIDYALQALVFSAGPSSVHAFAEIFATTSLSSGYAVICNTDCTDNSTNRAGTFHVNVYAGSTSNTITLEVQALAGGYSTIPANSSSAYADPRIYIDPSFADASAYRIALSDGVANGMAAAVPEPSDLALMVGGLGIVGWAVPRRRRQAARQRAARAI